MQLKEILKYTGGLCVLYVEDDLNLLKETSETLNDLFQMVDTASNGEEALEKYISFYNRRGEFYDIVITDIKMPQMDGEELISEIIKLNSEQPIIVISAHSESDILIRLIQKGISNFVLKPIQPNLFINVLNKISKNIITQKNEKNYKKEIEDINKNLDQRVKKLSQEIIYTQRLSIETLADLVEDYDLDTGAHTKRIELYTKILLDNLDKTNISLKNTHKTIPFASLLHDIGKLFIPKKILTKPAPLTPKEREIINTHAALGGKALEKANDRFRQKFNKDSYLKIAALIATYHHEKYDGTGYPKGLKKEQIPLCARIVAIADVYDALRSKRVYKDSFSHEKAVQIIKSESGKSFDPVFVDIFLKNHQKFNEVFNKLT